MFYIATIFVGSFVFLSLVVSALAGSFQTNLEKQASETKKTESDPLVNLLVAGVRCVDVRLL